VDNGSNSDDDLLVLEVFYPLSRTYKHFFVRPDPADRNPQVLESMTPLAAQMGPEWESRVRAQASRVRKAPEPAADVGPSVAPPAKRVKKSSLGPLERKRKSKIPTSFG
jgi:hypothetical protein